MIIAQYISLAGLAICFLALFTHFIRLISLGNPKDLSKKSGNVTKGIIYSNTVAMSPTNKESAYLHLPTYTAGILYHIGTFLSLLIFILSFFNFFNSWVIGGAIIPIIAAIYLLLSFTCGVILFIKRAMNKDLKKLTNPDDFLSNAFTTFFHLFTLLFLLLPENNVILNTYYIFITLLFLYMPLGKLKHVVYYFAARYHIGYFYGWRNVWPNNK